jgi:2-polyprenyl-6-methoxyphenol hydroxylase-like FAD-dependent oxidoreductase
MQVGIVGAGPAGLYLAMALARRGHRVLVVDRDRGPTDRGWSNRAGVMQFHHPHFFRQPVLDALAAETPEVWNALHRAGAVPVGAPERPQVPAGFRCRRVTFERLLRAAAEQQHGVTLRVGHAERVELSRGRAVGVSVDGTSVPAELVIDASGRSGRFTSELRRPGESSECGIAYVSRQYRLHPGAPDGPTNAPPGLIAWHRGYFALAFPHERRTLSVLIARPSNDQRLAGLRVAEAFDAAATAIPALAAWTHPTHAQPISPVLPGGRLHNTYRGQPGPDGRIIDGLIFLGDTVLTTNPIGGLGVATSLLQARALLGFLDELGRDFTGCALAFDAWCEHAIKPWFTDYVYRDSQVVRRWAGADVDLHHRLPSDLIVAAAHADPTLVPAVAPYLLMQAPPASLDTVEQRARAIYASGWRPPVPPGPDVDELAELVTRTAGARPEPSLVR